MRSSRIKKKLDTYIDKSRFSNVAKSTRRLFFNHLNLSTEERGRFHVDQMYGSGSGVLIRFNGTFFLLTAKHVIHNNIPGEFQNESPFWITSRFQSKWESLYDFLFPKRIWYIGNEVKSDSINLDLTDVCLVELFYPQPFHFPDHFIEIRSQRDALGSHEFFEGQFLLVTGYPFERNTFDFTPISDAFTHSTSINRHTIPGIYTKDEDFGHIIFRPHGDAIRHSNVNGMSGGAIYNVQPKANQVKLAGIPVTAGDNVCRFIPSYVFMDSLINYQKSEPRTVDPIVENDPPIEEKIRVFVKYLKAFDPTFPSKHQNESI
jgi:hypothetical protein